MPKDLISSWPMFRLDPEAKERIESILSRAGDRTSVTKVLNAILKEAIAQIESREASPPAMLTVHKLRAAIGHPPITHESADRLNERDPIAELMRRMDQAEKELREVRESQQESEPKRRRA